MASSANHGGGAAKQLRVLLPFSCEDRLRIPDELAEDIGAGEALVVGPCGVKSRAVWPVGLGRDGGGAFLGRGWPEFAPRTASAPAGISPSATAAAACSPSRRSTTAAASGTSALNNLQPQLIPAKFVQYYITKRELNNHMAVVFSPLGKVNSIKLEMDQSDVFFAGGWPQFLAFHGITESNALLLRYESNMVFTVKVFEPDGCQRKPKHKDNIMQQSEQEISKIMNFNLFAMYLNVC
ncbi:hypothetical protein GQ55_7G097500 [Panicum hallii var. hallii]|uniref:TF-B3 domain-containing protein n=1 Tax=Panicum hallii var. hallii TaxID=1504633 RepID=A0A2T7CTG6_9POAL|nr:hypothetical protein GQ55_7G097500 [Panicum hallii var. hallii]